MNCVSGCASVFLWRQVGWVCEVFLRLACSPGVQNAVQHHKARVATGESPAHQVGRAREDSFTVESAAPQSTGLCAWEAR